MAGVFGNKWLEALVFISVLIFLIPVNQARAQANATPSPTLTLDAIRQSARQKPPYPLANPPSRDQKKSTNNVTEKTLPPGNDASVDEIRVYGTIDPEDIERPDKTPIQKLRDTLDKAPIKRGTDVKERVTSDGRRIAQIDVDGKRFCVEDRSGQIDFAGMGRGGAAMRLVMGKECR
jgi:hypothetical protein